MDQFTLGLELLP